MVNFKGTIAPDASFTIKSTAWDQERKICAHLLYSMQLTLEGEICLLAVMINGLAVRLCSLSSHPDPHHVPSAQWWAMRGYQQTC